MRGPAAAAAPVLALLCGQAHRCRDDLARVDRQPAIGQSHTVVLELSRRRTSEDTTLEVERGSVARACEPIAVEAERAASVRAHRCHSVDAQLVPPDQDASVIEGSRTADLEVG